jgi:hypothetical protein
MAWLRKLLGLDAGIPAAAVSAPAELQHGRLTITRYGGHIVSVREIDFSGQCAQSPNGRFTLLWRDRYTLNDDLQGGRYVLIDDGRLVLDEAMARPQDGKVANDGVFILNDWGSSEGLAGTFHAFAPDGREILARHFTANLFNNGLSDDGCLAVSQTCNAPGSPDSSILCVFDLVAGQEVACWSPQSGWADAYEFPAGGDRVRMLRRDRAPIDYSLQGDFIDRRKWYRDEVTRGTFHIIKDALKEGEAVTGLNPGDLRRGAITAIDNPDDRFKADSLRLLGEIEEQAGDDRAALAAYRQALAINPRIGVAKRAAALARTLDA